MAGGPSDDERQCESAGTLPVTSYEEFDRSKWQLTVDINAESKAKQGGNKWSGKSEITSSLRDDRVKSP